jgi:hypothetical protein
VDEPRQAIKEATDDIIAWHVAQQQKWGEFHRAELSEKYGSAHAIYLEAAWRRWHDKPPVDEHLSPVALEKWSGILHPAQSDSPFADWARAWRSLPADLGDDEIRAACLRIVTGDQSGSIEQARDDYAPPYEISFHEAKDEVLEAAANEGRWPFRIDIGDATELFLVVTDAGDGGQGEYAVWQKGRFVFKDGTAKPWQEAVQLFGANSGKPYAWGVDGDSVSFLPALRGEPIVSEREAIVHHSISGRFGIRDGKWKLNLCAGSGGWSHPREDAAEQMGLPRSQLYDLDADPGETNNLIDAEPDQAERLTALLRRYIDEGRSTPGPKLDNDVKVNFALSSRLQQATIRLAEVLKTGEMFDPQADAELIGALQRIVWEVVVDHPHNFDQIDFNP